MTPKNYLFNFNDN